MSRDLDRPMWIDQRPWFEIWFAVVIDENKRRAAWIRQTMFIPKHGDGRATVWAAWFDADAATPARARKRILPLSAVRAGTGDVLVHHDDCALGRAGATGHAGDLAWKLAWSGGKTERAPLPSWLPAPTHAKPILHDADATGEITLGGDTRHALRGRALVMRLYGKRRLPTLQWMWAPWLGDAALEMTAASLQDSFSLGLAELRLDGPKPLRGRPASAAHPGGLVTATIAGPQRLVHARAWAEPAAMVGYVYRDTDGRDLMVAQSDSGSAQLEIWTRKLPGAPWRLTDDKRSAGGVAVEIHQHEALPGVSYLGWDGLGSDAEIAVAPAAASDPESVAWPELGAIVALGLTYADHVRETGGTPSASAPIVAFAKHARAFVRDDGAFPILVPTPTAADTAAAAVALEPALEARLSGAPAVMDYEGELALVALGPIDVAALAAGTPQPLGLAAANDLTARLVQVLGEGQPDPYLYWAAAKSFARFLPVAPRVWAPAGGIATMPDVTIETRVNGERRQHASTRELIYDLAALVRAAQAQLGRPLARGDVVLTGTPAGVGMRLSPLQRRIAARVTDRFRKLDLLVSSYASSSALLRPGDLVEVDCGRAGQGTRAHGGMRRLALQLCLASSAVLVAMTITCAVTGATQEAHEHFAPSDVYAAGLLAHAGALRLVFGLDVAFLVLYTLMFTALAAHLRTRGGNALLLGVALGALLGTCLLDIIEDHHILALLGIAEAGRPIDEGAIAWQDVCSATKFTLSYVGLVGLGLAIPRDRGLATALAAFLVVGTLASAVLAYAAPPAWREQLDSGRWLGFLIGFLLTAAWLRGEPEPAVSSGA